jgi:hypothetical protein
MKVLQSLLATRRGATSPVALVALVIAGSIAVALPRMEARHRETVDDELTTTARHVVTSQRAHAARTGEFFRGRRWLGAGQYGRLVLPVLSEHRVLTYYSRAQRGLVVVVGDVSSQRVCSAVVRMHADDRPTRLNCADEMVPQ